MTLLSRAMVLSVIVLLLTTHRLPAPITEISEPTATPNAKAKKASAKNESRPAAKPAAKPAGSFAGTWTGTTQGTGNTTFGNQKNSSSYSIQISPDEKTLSVEQKGNYYSKLRLSQIACNRHGDSLIWSYEGSALVRVTGTCTLRLNADGTAGLTDQRRYHSVDRFVLTMTGTLMRQ